ncbi:Mcm10p-like'Mcm10p-like' [Cryptosporidium canis]|uniref:Mcm10p-like'Mcm10p-like n=1 Tax=Cryptosporidium canis TaxID=195482 RepID=A0A9D5DQL2_9CRYT|nr:Mcm10p-like'Mcm10p-like' [Cryptosporidium canis]
MKNLERVSDKNTNVFEENSGLILEKFYFPKVRLEELVEGGNLLKLSGVDQIKNIPNDSSKNNYLLVVFYSVVNDSKFCNDNGLKYIVWNVTDLRGNKTRLYLFGEVFEFLKSEDVGNLYLIINPSIITSDEQNNKCHLSISKVNQVIKVGKVHGFSICKGTNKSGTLCSNPIDSNYQDQFCKYHSSLISTECLKRSSANVQPVSLLHKNDKSMSLANTNIIQTEHSMGSFNENKIRYKRSLKKDRNVTELSKWGLDLKRVRNDVCSEHVIQEVDIFDLNNKLNKAVKENNTTETLSILRHLYSIDTSNITLDRIEKSGIIYTISNIELNDTEIETATFALKIRHKLCNNKGYWPRIKLQISNENFKGVELHSDKSWENVHEQILSLEGEISNKEVNNSDLIIKHVVGERKRNLQRKSALNNILSKIDGVLSLNTSCDDEIIKLESNKLQTRLIDLEKADKILEIKRNINSVKISNAVNCTRCGIWTEGSANLICKKEHPEFLLYNRGAKKESWSCKSCNGQIYSINGYYNSYCPWCKTDTVCNLKRNSIYRLNEDLPDKKDILIIRNGERESECK